MNEKFTTITFIIVFSTASIAMSAKEKIAKQPERTSQRSHNHRDDGKVDHNNPKNQHRMGIFHYNEGNRFLRQGEWEKAVHNYKMALHHDKTIFAVYVNLSSAFLQGKEFQQALKILRKLETIQPHNPMLYYNLACYYSLVGNLLSALNSLKKAGELGFENIRQIKSDPDLENLRKDARFSKWLEKF